MRKRPERKNYRRIGKFQNKLLTALQAGLAVGLTRSSSRQFKIISEVGSEFKKINTQTLNRSIRTLFEAKYIYREKQKDGTTKIVLTKDGEKKVLIGKLNHLTIKKPKTWNGYFWVVMFDIPESRKRIRDSLRYQLKKIGFIELQKSVFVHPYECVETIKFVTEYYNVLDHLRIMEVRSINREKEVLEHFKLS